MVLVILLKFFAIYQYPGSRNHSSGSLDSQKPVLHRKPILVHIQFYTPGCRDPNVISLQYRQPVAQHRDLGLPEARTLIHNEQTSTVAVSLRIGRASTCPRTHHHIRSLEWKFLAAKVPVIVKISNISSLLQDHDEVITALFHCPHPSPHKANDILQNMCFSHRYYFTSNYKNNTYQTINNIISIA